MTKDVEYYVGFTPLSVILKSANIKYLQSKLSEAETRMCGSYVYNTIKRRISELTRHA